MVTEGKADEAVSTVSPEMHAAPFAGDGGESALSKSILPHLLKLYDRTATAEDFLFYHDKATFEDPLLHAQGIRQIKSAFYSMKLLFSESGIREWTIQESLTGASSGEISIDNTQHYRFGKSTFDVVSLIKLKVEQGKVVEHVDLWKKEPLWTGRSKGLVGYGAQGIRRGNMLLTHLLMGFGRDRGA